MTSSTVWYLEKERTPDHFLILLNNPKQPLDARNSFKNKAFGRELSKNLKKVNLFFLSNSVPFNEESYQKQNGPRTSHQSLFRSQNKFRKIPLFAMYYLTNFDDVM